jgi:hypothetical protein
MVEQLDKTCEECLNRGPRPSANLYLEWKAKGEPPGKEPKEWIYTDDAVASCKHFVKTRVLEDALRVGKELSEEHGFLIGPEPMLSIEEIDSDPIKAAFLLELIQSEGHYLNLYTDPLLASEYKLWLEKA